MFACNLALACLVVALLRWRPSIDTGQRVQLHTAAEELPEGFGVTVRTCLSIAPADYIPFPTRASAD